MSSIINNNKQQSDEYQHLNHPYQSITISCTKNNTEKKQKPKTPLLDAFTSALLTPGSNQKHLRSKISQKPLETQYFDKKQQNNDVLNGYSTLLQVSLSSSPSSSSPPTPNPTTPTPSMSYIFSDFKPTHNVSPPRNSNQFKTLLTIGPDFNAEDITVQLTENYANSKKLFIHCFRVEAVNKFSLKSSDLANQNITTDVGLEIGGNNENTQPSGQSSLKKENYIKKEIQRDVHLPINADLNTLESYLEDGELVIECKLLPRPELKLPHQSLNQTSSKSMPSENFIFQNPLFNQSLLNHAYSKDNYLNQKQQHRLNERPKIQRRDELLLNEPPNLARENGCDAKSSTTNPLINSTTNQKPPPPQFYQNHRYT